MNCKQGHTVCLDWRTCSCICHEIWQLTHPGHIVVGRKR
jgi:hypothetical protein